MIIFNIISTILNIIAVVVCLIAVKLLKKQHNSTFFNNRDRIAIRVLILLIILNIIAIAQNIIIII